ncbi:hypothetical protein HZC09_01530 [Candidatus Micrarchaeota archaeon]|nr:hypothetical protein [Candidatus Micrarchaeota archaeon]
MTFKHFLWDASVTKNKPLTVKNIAEFFFDNPTEAYRFTRALLLVKEKSVLRLRDCPKDLPVTTWKRYLDFGAQAGLLQHEGLVYSMSARFPQALKNFAGYAAKWLQDGSATENAKDIFPDAKKGVEKSRRTKPNM